jgi:L-seryl-tRNA(Ser) seleniumtransferase
MKRRDILKGLTIAPLALGAAPLNSFAGSHVFKETNLFNELGVRTFINAAGTLTYMSGSLMHPEVVKTIREAANHFCMMDELQDKVGELIAEMVHAEAATVTSGAFSAMTLGLAGILTGLDLKKVEQLPHLQGTGMKTEVICQKSHDERYNHAFLNTGCTIITVETLAELENAINDKTAMLHFLNIAADHGKINHADWLAVGKKYKIPVSIDIAADVPPVSNIWKFNDMGFDLVFLSGGKAIRGPQSAGLLMGRKNIIEAARLSAPPRGFNVGRAHKVNKEEILGMYVALKKYINTDHDKEWQNWESEIDHINNAVKNIKGISTKIIVPTLGNITPNLVISWDPSHINLTGKDLRETLRNGNPSIEAGFAGLPLYPNQAGSESIDPKIAETLKGENKVTITVWMLQQGEYKMVAKKLKEAFDNALI